MADAPHSLRQDLYVLFLCLKKKKKKVTENFYYMKQTPLAFHPPTQRRLVLREGAQ